MVRARGSASIVNILSFWSGFSAAHTEHRSPGWLRIGSPVCQTYKNLVLVLPATWTPAADQPQQRVHREPLLKRRRSDLPDGFCSHLLTSQLQDAELQVKLPCKLSQRADSTSCPHAYLSDRWLLRRTLVCGRSNLLQVHHFLQEPRGLQLHEWDWAAPSCPGAPLMISSVLTVFCPRLLS